jgi:GNAT superfamily N-acetyltransferase
MIRKAVRADLPEIARVMRDSLAALSSGFYDERETASAVAHIAVVDEQLVDDGTYFVAEEQGRIIACGGWSGRTKLFTGTTAQAQAEGFLHPRTDAARIRAMFVEPSHARRGLGRQILEASEDDARRAGFTRFELMATLPGVPLYTACGYEEIERDTIELPDGMRVGVVRMGRQVK